MRKLIVSNIISLDGYCEGPGGNVMALPMDHSFDAYNAERLAAADTLLLGRKTYELFRGYWPDVVDNSDASPDEREISRLENAIEKVVVSNNLSADQTEPWRDTTRIVPRKETHAQVAELKGGSGGEILVFGSHTLWNDLLAARLVDELHLMIGSAPLGGGTPAFATEPPAPFRLLDARAQEGSNNLLARYAASD
jgi:dihydrofolate reductase